MSPRGVLFTTRGLVEPGVVFLETEIEFLQVNLPPVEPHLTHICSCHVFVYVNPLTRDCVHRNIFQGKNGSIPLF